MAATKIAQLGLTPFNTHLIDKVCYNPIFENINSLKRIERMKDKLRFELRQHKLKVLRI
jgi:hypothetical protein